MSWVFVSEDQSSLVELSMNELSFDWVASRSLRNSDSHQGSEVDLHLCAGLNTGPHSRSVSLRTNRQRKIQADPAMVDVEFV